MKSKSIRKRLLIRMHSNNRRVHGSVSQSVETGRVWCETLKIQDPASTRYFFCLPFTVYFLLVCTGNEPSETGRVSKTATLLFFKKRKVYLKTFNNVIEYTELRSCSTLSVTTTNYVKNVKFWVFPRANTVYGTFMETVNSINSMGFEQSTYSHHLLNQEVHQFYPITSFK